MNILKTDSKKDDRFLRTPLSALPFRKTQSAELRALAREMRRVMKEADGIGLAANQVGIAQRIFVAELPDDQGKPKFYTIVNPRIVKRSEETITLEEGCLSVPQTFGGVPRSKHVILEGLTPQGRKIKIKAWNLLARVFQHEVDHLDGILFTDKAGGVSHTRRT